MGQFNFKSSGTTKSQSLINAAAVPQSPPVIGILTPLALDTTNGNLLVTSTDLAVQLADNLRNLILTNWGERLGLYKFGANLRPLMTDLVSLDDFDSKAVTLIRQAVQRWMPYIDLQSFESNTTHVDNKQTAIILLLITYNIPTLGVKNKKLQVTLYAI